MDPNTFFREVALRICGSLDIQQALEPTFQYIRRHIPAESMGLVYYDLAQERMFPMASIAEDGAAFFWEGSMPELALDKEQVAYLATKEEMEESVHISSQEGIPEMILRVFPQLVSSSILELSLRIRGQFIGILVLTAKGADRYTKAHADLMEVVIEPFSIATSNARHYIELTRMKELLAEDNRALTTELQRLSGTEVVGADSGLLGVMELVQQIAASSSPALLLGETGTGKEVIANAIHMASPRRDGPMIRMQCGAIPETLLDSELFGYEQGSFTGATRLHRGRFERADGGTLFLDEIGELSPMAQVKLLRVLQEKQFERVGGTQTLTVDVRVVAATHRDLEAMVRAGSFREDLWYRLNVLPIRLPPLRHRREDIPSLVQYFVRRKAQEMNLLKVPHMSGAALERLMQYDWPGNVRELQNIVERALILSRGGELVFPALHMKQPVAAPAVEAQTPGLCTMDEAIARHIRLALQASGGQIAGAGGAAELLDMHPNTLRFRMKKLKIQRV